MFRTLRAFAWLRWRMLINSLEKTGARDTVERFSLAIEKLGPIIAGVLLIPSSLVLAALSAAGGYALARGEEHSLLFETARYLLLFVPLFSIVGPLMLPAADRTNPVRMLLLPISRGTLYVAQSASAFGDVWVLLMLPIVVSVPLGLAAGGAFGAALLALISGALLVAVVIAIASIATSLLHLLVRDRRRGELVALVFVLIIPMAGILPHVFGRAPRAARTETPGRPEARQRMIVPPWVTAAGERAFTLYPTELYTSSIRAAARRVPVRSATSVAMLAAAAVLLNALGMFVFRRVLDSPGSTGRRRAVPTRAAWGRTLPGLSPGASAVALAQVRLALRTPRGRATLLSPIVMLSVYAVIMGRAGENLHFSGFTLETGLALAAFGSFVCLLSVLPIAMNQFAVDKAGLTLTLLSPLTDREYLTGKAVGNGLIAALPAVFCVVASSLARPGGSVTSWLAIAVGLLSTYLLVAPAAAVLSATFPRVVDMNSIGRGSNAHGLAGLLGMLAFLLAGAPSLLIAMAASHWLRSSSLALLGVVVWCVIAFGICRLLFGPARKIFEKRRENLAMLQ